MPLCFIFCAGPCFSSLRIRLKTTLPEFEPELHRSILKINSRNPTKSQQLNSKLYFFFGHLASKFYYFNMCHVHNITIFPNADVLVYTVGVCMCAQCTKCIRLKWIQIDHIFFLFFSSSALRLPKMSLLK